MNKINCVVPKGIRFISDWQDFHLPEKPTIIDKQVTGCGFTEYCLTNDQNIILCSPRLILLENKESQHEGELMYVKNELETILNVDSQPDDKKGDNQSDVDEFMDRAAEDTNTSREELTAQYYANLRNDIREYYLLRQSQSLPCKFIVTYDSFRHVREALIEAGILREFYIVVDEFQSIFTDSRFKSTTEIGFMQQLSDLNKVCFVSATPMMDSYLDEIEPFKHLDFITLDWSTEDPGRIISPQIIAKPAAGLTRVAVDIINEYLDGRFRKYTWRDDATGELRCVESKELVIYVNSVKNICDIIKKAGLTLDNTNILCSKTKDNVRKLKKALGLGRKKVDPLGTIPKRGEHHKMFTLCTRTVYLGADFYSTNARTLILSDSNVDCLSVDITLDLPQIMGRQRLDENPWKNRAELYFKSTRKDRAKTAKEFYSLMEKRQKATNDLLQVFKESRDELRDSLAQVYERTAARDHYSENYVAVDSKIDGSRKFPVQNDLVRLADKRTYEIQQKDYKDQFSVFNAIERDGNNKDNNKEIDEAIGEFDKIRHFPDRMKFICDLGEMKDVVWVDLFLQQVPLEFGEFYHILGPEKCKALKYRQQPMREECENLLKKQDGSDDLRRLVYDRVEVGKRYKKSDLKELFKEMYCILGIADTPKAILVGDFFNIKPVLINDPVTKKRDSGYEILSRKE